MIENPVYLSNGHEECQIPGWYFIVETDIYDGPYKTKVSAEQALNWYIQYHLSNDHKEK